MTDHPAPNPNQPDALPVASVVITPLGAAEVRDAKNSGGRYLRTFNGADHWMSLWSEQARMLPARVLYEPEETR